MNARKNGFIWYNNDNCKYKILKILCIATYLVNAKYYKYMQQIVIATTRSKKFNTKVKTKH